MDMAAEACSSRGWEVDLAAGTARVTRVPDGGRATSSAGVHSRIGAEHIGELLAQCVDPGA